jgi:tryptophanyl-tRNA synthetase
MSQDSGAIITPWEVKGKINYIRLIEKFGTNAIGTELVERWERVTGKKAHRFLRRGLVFSHQDLELILDDIEAGKPVYIYTGRGPSSESMHLGHMVPFMFTKYLQDALNCITVIQMSDDEKFYFKNGSTSKDLDWYRKLSYKNAKDIIACGFDPKKTLIFSNLESNCGSLYFNNTLIMKATPMNQVKGIYGLGEVVDPIIVETISKSLENESDQNRREILEKFVERFKGKEESNSVGQCAWPCFQCGPAFCTSFKDIFVKSIKCALNQNIPDQTKTNLKSLLGQFSKNDGASIRCLVPMAIDQAPYFRMARDVAHKLGCPKPAVIHSEFLPGLRQCDKMSSTDNQNNATLFLDIKPTEIGKIIKKNAFSGGCDTLEEHRKMGGDIMVDVCYKYLTYFMESDAELKKIAMEYSDGNMTTGQLKEITANVVSKVIETHQKAKQNITEEQLMEFFNKEKEFDIITKNNDNEVNDYAGKGMGIDYDRTFGIVRKCDRQSV